MLQDLIAVSALDNGYLVLFINRESKKTTHTYCANETAVADEVYSRLESRNKEGGRLTMTEFAELSANSAETSTEDQ